MNRIDKFPDPETIFAGTRMSFGDHLEELRARLIRAVLGLVIGLLVSFLFGDAVVQFITHPVEVELMKFYNRRLEKVAKRLREGDPTVAALNNFKEVPVQATLRAFLDLLPQREFLAPQPAPSPVEHHS